MASNDHPTLAADFPQASAQQWAALVAKASSRSGAPTDPAAAVAKLAVTTYDGISIAPLYTAVEAAALDPGLPGFPPFVRGLRPTGSRADGWDVRQPVLAGGEASVAEEELDKGATGVVLSLRHVESPDANVVRAALRGVYLDIASVALDAGIRWQPAAEALVEVWRQSGIEPESCQGLLGADPLGEHLSLGGVADLDSQLDSLGRWAPSLLTERPKVRLVAVHGTRLHAAGASEAEELGGTVAAGVEYLRVLEARGIDVAQAFSLIELQLAATADQFATIAKFRAARLMWARVADALGHPEAAGTSAIHATTSMAMLTAYDPWVNLLRSTVACFAAGVGGADSITVLPHDHLLTRTDDELGRRLARNTQSILAMESNLTKVIDPAGGSWFVEDLTRRMADAAWIWFQEIEAAGGFRAASESGLIARRLDATWQERVARIDDRRDPITGVSEFPDIAETPARPAAPTVVAAGTGFPPLRRHRYAERFEALRQRVDRHTAATGRRPSLFLAAIGDPAATTARVTFAKNLFEVAGVRTIDGPPTTDPAAIADAFAASGASVACVCSSDAVYAEHALPVVGALTGREPRSVYLAGRPRGLTDELAAAGVDHFVHAGCDVHAVLSELLTVLKVP